MSPCTKHEKVNAITDAHHDVTKSNILTAGKLEIVIYIFFLIIKINVPFMDSFFKKKLM